MANDIGRAMSRLKHRDIRTRRRAVRTLFEHDDPSVLDAFEPLLDDDMHGSFPKLSTRIANGLSSLDPVPYQRC